jgi:hypothetical protein
MKSRHFLFLAVLLALALLNEVEAGTIDFEELADSTQITNQYPGITFLNTTVLTAGMILNEFEYPPHSGTNVACDDGGPITMLFSTPLLSATGYITHSVRIIASFYDFTNTEVGTFNSAFSSNLALSGDVGSSPNELIFFSWALGISKIEIAGDPYGCSFVIDDLNGVPKSPAVPEPATLIFIVAGILGVIAFDKFKFCKKL